MHAQSEASNTTDVHGIMYFTEHFPYLTNLAKRISEPVDGLKKITALLKWKRFSNMTWKTATVFSNMALKIFRPHTSELSSVMLHVSIEG